MIHRPKVIQSNIPYGLPANTVVMTKNSDNYIITSEFWNDSPKPLWKIGHLIIARKGFTWKKTWELGNHFVVTTIYSAEGSLIGSYWDISSAVQKIENDFVYEDWYLDVWVPAESTPQLLGETELAEAMENHYISPTDADTARWTVFRILELFKVR